MPHRGLVIVLALLASGACKKDEPAAAASAPLSRPQQCEQFAQEMASTVLLTGQILVTALDDEPAGASAQAGREEMKDAARKVRVDLTAKCMTWPEEVMQCLPPLGILREGCEQRLLAAMDGATPPPEHVPPGPAAAWSFALESEPRALAVADDGTVVVIAGVEGSALVGLRDGAVAWRREGDHAPWLLPLPGAPLTWVAAEANTVVAFDPETGTERWVASLPALPEDEGGSEPVVKVAAVDGTGLLVGDAEARFFSLRPAACESGAAACVDALGRLTDEFLDTDARLFVSAAGRRTLREDDAVRVLDPDWRAVATIGAHDALGAVVPREGGLMLVVDDDVVDLDPSRCEGAGDVTLGVSGWPQPGALTIGASACEACRPPPPGCRRWRVYVEGSTSNQPVRLADGMVVIHGDEHTHGLHQGLPRWKIGLGGVGPLATDGARVFGVGIGHEEDDPPVVFELDPATGVPRWQSPLGGDDETSVYGSDVRIGLASGRLAVSAQQRVVVFAVPDA